MNCGISRSWNLFEFIFLVLKDVMSIFKHFRRPSFLQSSNTEDKLPCIPKVSLEIAEICPIAIFFFHTDENIVIKTSEKDEKGFCHFLSSSIACILPKDVSCMPTLSDYK